jgi:hypothetical protein
MTLGIGKGNGINAFPPHCDAALFKTKSFQGRQRQIKHDDIISSLLLSSDIMNYIIVTID